ncbi:Os03g0696500 [Oryza sativa Japonica Group]|uniref:Os03g0696500 protein n=1 Tax=Oryza sativa subsp. japonica TaxID=39947 RepID=A0A0N7KHV7_ORYSJ|nr:Os03g0696500 [Oryza sativa Japonica Group]
MAAARRSARVDSVRGLRAAKTPPVSSSGHSTSTPAMTGRPCTPMKTFFEAAVRRELNALPAYAFLPVLEIARSGCAAGQVLKGLPDLGHDVPFRCRPEDSADRIPLLLGSKRQWLRHLEVQAKEASSCLRSGRQLRPLLKVEAEAGVVVHGLDRHRYSRFKFLQCVDLQLNILL